MMKHVTDRKDPRASPLTFRQRVHLNSERPGPARAALLLHALPPPRDEDLLQTHVSAERSEETWRVHETEERAGVCVCGGGGERGRASPPF